ncbi:MAG: 6,7-dimethyl-8-ribityllumazine synthase [Edaphocola sp.]
MALSTESTALLDLQTLSKLAQPRVAIMATEWNDKIVAEQIAGAQKIAQQTGAVITHIYYVPGCFELPFACRALWEAQPNMSDAPEAMIAFGAVIRGGTPHFDYVCKAVTEGILQLNLALPVPVIFGVLTLDTEAQAWERLGGLHGHKGEEAMITALKMIGFKRGL